MRGYAEIVRHLAMARADLNASCADGSTALLQAAYVGSVDAGHRAPCAVVVALLRVLGAEDYCRGVPELELAIGAEIEVLSVPTRTAGGAPGCGARIIAAGWCAAAAPCTMAGSISCRSKVVAGKCAGGYKRAGDGKVGLAKSWDAGGH